MAEKTNTVILPWFTVENHETLTPFLGRKEMYELLQRGGFKVRQVFDINGQILDLEIHLTAINHIRFEAELPSDWSLGDGYDGYGFKDSSIVHLLDGNGHLRGHICLDWEDDYAPHEAQLYCRYALNPLNVHTAKVARSRNSIVDVVVDRTAVSPEKPAKFPIVMHYDARPAKPGPIEPPDLKEFEKFYNEETARVKSGQPRLDPPIYRWLHENYPQWRDPFAYW